MEEALTKVAAMAIRAIRAIRAIGQAPGASAAFNQAENNYVSHSPFPEVRRTWAWENSRLHKECGDTRTHEDFTRIDRQVAQLEIAANLIGIGKRNTLTPKQATLLAQTMLELVAIYGNIESVTQLITG